MIIAIREKDRIVFGYSGNDRDELIAPQDRFQEENIPIRVVNKENGTVVAFVNHSRASDVFLWDDEFLQEDMTVENLQRKIIPYMKYTLKEEKILSDKKWNNMMLIAREGRLFDVTNTFQLLEEKDYICHGYAGIPLAIGSLELWKGESAEKRILEAFKLCSEIQKIDYFPFVLIDTKDFERKIIYQ